MLNYEKILDTQLNCFQEIIKEMLEDENLGNSDIRELEKIKKIYSVICILFGNEVTNAVNDNPYLEDKVPSWYKLYHQLKWDLAKIEGKMKRMELI